MKRVIFVAMSFMAIFFLSCKSKTDNQNKEWQQRMEQEGKSFQERKDKALRETTVHQGLIESINTVEAK